MSRIIARSGGTPILMEVNDITARKQQLIGLATDLASTVGLGRVVGGTSTPAAVAAAQAAASDMYSDLKAAGTNLKAMAAMLSRRISYMKEFDREYPPTFATASDAKRAGARLAEQLGADPDHKHYREYFAELQRNSLDPDFARGFLLKYGFENMQSLIFDNEPYLTDKVSISEYHETMGRLVGAATQRSAFSRAQLAEVFRWSTTYHRNGTDFFFHGFADGSGLRPPTLLGKGEKPSMVSRLLLDFMSELRGDAPYGYLEAVDLVLAGSGRDVYLLLSGSFGSDGKPIEGLGLGRAELREMIQQLLGGRNRLDPNDSALLVAMAMVNHERIDALPRHPADAFEQISREWMQYETVMATIESEAMKAAVGSARERDAFVNAIRRASFTAALTLAGMTLPAGVPTTLALKGAGMLTVPKANEAGSVAASMISEAASAFDQRSFAFAANTIYYLHRTGAPADSYPTGWDKVFKVTGGQVEQLPSADRGDILEMMNSLEASTDLTRMRHDKFSDALD